MKTDILLSTYNGAAFLDDLIQSLTVQTFPDWRLLVRDDGSSDSTMAVLKSWQRKDKQRICILEDDKQHLGPKKSFERLLLHSDADYILFCDQDDFWLPDKIEKSLGLIKKLETGQPGKPVLVFSDLTVVDQKLRTIASSFWHFTGVDPQNTQNIYKLLVNNPVVGATVMINKAVKKAVLPFPEQAVMHDWWMALQVARKGTVGYLDRPTVLYRLHRDNTIGAERADNHYFSGKVKKLRRTFEQNKKALQMLRTLDFRLSEIKFLYYKIVITFSRIFSL